MSKVKIAGYLRISVDTELDKDGINEYLGNYEESPYYKQTYAEFAAKYSL